MATVVLVEDSSFFRKQIVSYLENGGHQVVGLAADGISAFAAYQKFHPQFVVMDVVLPKVSGLVACYRIHQMNTSAKIILYSALEREDIATQAYTVGAVDFLLKPFDELTLLSTFSRIITGSKKRKRVRVTLPAKTASK